MSDGMNLSLQPAKLCSTCSVALGGVPCALSVPCDGCGAPCSTVRWQTYDEARTGESSRTGDIKWRPTASQIHSTVPKHPAAPPAPERVAWSAMYVPNPQNGVSAMPQALHTDVKRDARGKTNSGDGRVIQQGVSFRVLPQPPHSTTTPYQTTTARYSTTTTYQTAAYQTAAGMSSQTGLNPPPVSSKVPVLVPAPPKRVPTPVRVVVLPLVTPTSTASISIPAAPIAYQTLGLLLTDLNRLLCTPHAGREFEFRGTCALVADPAVAPAARVVTVAWEVIEKTVLAFNIHALSVHSSGTTAVATTQSSALWMGDPASSASDNTVNTDSDSRRPCPCARCEHLLTISVWALEPQLGVAKPKGEGIWVALRHFATSETKRRRADVSMGSNTPVFWLYCTSGSAAVDTVLSDGRYTPRAVSRSLDSVGSKALISKGVEVMVANLLDKESVKNALRDSEYVFGNKNWDRDPADPEGKGEIVQGKNLVDAAKEMGALQLSSQCNGLSKGLYTHIHHVDNKSVTEAYLKASGVPYAVLLTAWFTENLWKLGSLKKTDTGYTLPIPMFAPGEVQSSTWISHDFGAAALALLNNYHDVSKGVLGKSYPVRRTAVAPEKEVTFTPIATTGVVEIDELAKIGLYRDTPFPNPDLVQLGVQFGSLEEFIRAEVPRYA
ncbi:hypothetical protein B0H19DRAFT_1245374 [Mycena capillaripes]|nr:hypothetical protein B0H19DRAFT_1245374 [Mycena capillaripes]